MWSSNSIIHNEKLWRNCFPAADRSDPAQGLRLAVPIDNYDGQLHWQRDTWRGAGDWIG